VGSIQFKIHVFGFHQTLIKSSDLMLWTNFIRSYITTKHYINKSILPNTCILNCIDPTFEEDCAYSFFFADLHEH
jgi:hypothetical protein